MKIDQCLFGYDDGHRLLASSLPLESETSLLTELSDLAPGTIFGTSGGYWTGLPVPSIGRYALMRTWPAPEMSRPGCVWTHGIFIKPIQFELVSDLSIFTTLFRKPNEWSNWGSYKNPIDAELPDIIKRNQSVATDVLYEFISSLYSTHKSAVVTERLGDLDDAVFSVWSQQWPRLRRNFRFQTAVSRSLSVRGNAKFDIVPILEATETEETTGHNQNEDWIRAVIESVQNPTSNGLRDFLWIYGSGVKRQKGSFRPLTEIFLLVESKRENSTRLIFDIICKYFTGDDDAINLKQDLIDGHIGTDIQADFIYLIALNDSLTDVTFPLLSNRSFDKLENTWFDRPEFVLELLGIALNSKSPFCRSVSEILLNVVQTANFWKLPKPDLSVSREVLIKNPRLFFDNVNILGDEELIKLIPSIPEGESGLAEFLYELTLRNNRELVSTLLDKFPKNTLESFVCRVNDHQYKIQGNAWVDVIIKRVDLLFEYDVIRLVSRASLVFLICRSQLWFSQLVYSRDTSFWLDAFYNSAVDISSEDEDLFCCFLLVFACKKGGNSGYRAIEKVYHRVHKKVLKSQLRWDAKDMLMQNLPNIGRFSNWDLGLRLRLAVTAAYIDWHWPASSYGLLAKDKRNKTLLAEVVMCFDSAFEYFNALDK